MKFLKNLWNWIDGRKTIICSIIVIVLQSAVGEKYVPAEWLELLLTIFMGLGIGSLGHHVVKSVKKKKNG